MSKVRFGDVVHEIKQSVNRNNNPYDYYVAGDHMDTADLTIHRKGSFATDEVGPAFVREFKKGQVLYGSRRTYLKKVAVADFDGITANTTFVLETKNNNVFLQSLLPFVMLTDDFTDWSIKHSKGSTNPYVLFSDLADYEFELPDIKKQKELSDILWASFRLKESYRELIKQSDELIKSQFVEMFSGENYPLVSIKEVLNQHTVVERITNTLVEKYVTVALYGKGVRERSIEKYDPKPFSAYRVKAGQFIYSRIDARNGAFGIIPKELDGAVVSKDFPVFDIDLNRITPEYLIYCVLDNGFIQQIKINSIGTTNRQRVNEEALLSYKIKLPTVDEQNRFIGFVHQTDKSKLELNKAINDIDELMKSIMQADYK